MSTTPYHIDEIETPPLDDWKVFNINSRLLELMGIDKEEFGLIAGPPRDKWFEEQRTRKLLEDIRDAIENAKINTQNPNLEPSVRPKEFRKSGYYRGSNKENIGKKSHESRMNHKCAEPYQTSSERNVNDRNCDGEEKINGIMSNSISQKFANFSQRVENGHLEMQEDHETLSKSLYKLKPVGNNEDILLEDNKQKESEVTGGSEEKAQDGYSTPDKDTRNKAINENKLQLSDENDDTKTATSECSQETKTWGQNFPQCTSENKPTESSGHKIKYTSVTQKMKGNGKLMLKLKLPANKDIQIIPKYLESTLTLCPEYKDQNETFKTCRSKPIKVNEASVHEHGGKKHDIASESKVDETKGENPAIENSPDGSCELFTQGKRNENLKSGKDRKKSSYHINPAEESPELCDDKKSTKTKTVAHDDVTTLRIQTKTKQDKQEKQHETSKKKQDYNNLVNDDQKVISQISELESMYRTVPQESFIESTAMSSSDKEQVKKSGKPELINNTSDHSRSSEKLLTDETKSNQRTNEHDVQIQEGRQDSTNLEEYVFVDAQAELPENLSVFGSRLLDSVKNLATSFFFIGNIGGHNKKHASDNKDKVQTIKTREEAKPSKWVETPEKRLSSSNPEVKSRKSDLDSGKGNLEHMLRNSEIEKERTETNVPHSASIKFTSKNQSKRMKKDKKVKTEENTHAKKNKTRDNNKSHNLNSSEQCNKLTSQQEGDKLKVENKMAVTTKHTTAINVPSSSIVTSEFKSKEKEADNKKHYKRAEEKKNKDMKEKERNRTYDRMTSIDLFTTLVEEMIPHSTKEDAINVMIINSDADSEIACELARKLRKEFNFRVATASEVSVLRTMSPISYLSGAMNWADIIVPLITNDWLDDISNISTSPSRSKSSLGIRHCYMILRNRLLSGVHKDWQVVPAVIEGTDIRYREWPEFFNAIPIWTQFEKLGRVINDINKFSKSIN